MPIQNYVFGEVIGRGSYGEVTLATSKKDKKKYVIKKIDLHNASTKERTFAQQEVEILSKLRHPNIVSYKESFQSEEGHLSIVMGYCEGGDLYTKLKKQAKQSEYLTETQIVEWFVQIAMALQYMHDRNILHRDLKTQNIFLTKSKIIKLGDLGIARVLDSNCDMATTMIGTPYYMSPELFSNKPYNHKSDVWALGCCVYEMATLKHAFNAKDMNSLVYKILKGKTPVMPKHYSDELLDIIRSMLSYEPSKRPSASRILRHPFIKKHIAIFLEGTKNRQKRKSRDESSKNRDETRKSRDEIRKSRDETRRSLKKAEGSNEQPIEDVSETNAQAIATASKVDIELIVEEKRTNRKKLDNVIDDKESVKNNNNNNDIVYDTNSKELRKDDIIETEEEHADRSPASSAQSSRADSVKNLDPNNSPSGAVKNPSQVRKILHDRMRAKARLKEKKISDLQKKSFDQERVSSASSQEDRNEASERKIRSNEKRSSPSTKSERSRRPLPSLPADDVHDNEEKPALPPPRFKTREERTSKREKKEEFHKIDEDEPKASAGVPNMAARRKRRQKQRESQPQFSPPCPEKIDSVVLSHASYPRKSREEIIRNHLQRNSIQHEEKDVVDGPPRALSLEKIRQNSNDGSSSENDDVINPSASSHGKGSDVMNLIDTLQATLKMDAPGSANRKSPQESIDCPDEAISPSVSGRLKDRITRLRRECIQGVGIDVLTEAYKVIDMYSEEEAEERMVKLLGDRFEEFSGRIWQLKFCEEFK